MKLDKTMRGGFEVRQNPLNDLPTLRLKAHELVVLPLAATVIDRPASTAIQRRPAPEPVDAVIIPQRRPTRRQLAVLFAGLSWLFALAALYYSVSPGSSKHAQPLAAREPAPPRPAQAPAQPAAVEKAPPAAVQASALQAARAFALGDDARALELYRTLARQQPEQRGYSVLVGVLSRRTRER